MKIFKFAAVTVAILSLSLLTACADTDNGGNNQNSTSTTQNLTTNGSSSNTSAATTTESSSKDGDDTTAGGEDTDNGQTTVDTILEAIRKAYGDDYLSNTPITAEMLESTFGLSDDMYDAIASEMPMIGVHPDRVIVVKAKSGMTENVKKALETARQELINAETMYPMNIAKITSSQVVTNGDYVAYILAGAPDDRESATDSEMMEFAQKQTKIGVDAFNAQF